MENVSFVIAFVAGILSFLSPCVLPIIPGFISFLSGNSLKEYEEGVSGSEDVTKRILITSLSFIFGFSLVFICLGASASIMGIFLSENITVFSRISGIFIIIMGIHITGLFKIKWLRVHRKFHVKTIKPGIVEAFLIGLCFAFAWTPCVGPILASILTLAANEKTILKGILLLVTYSMGLGIPFLLAGFFASFFVKFLEKYRSFIRKGEIVCGILLVSIGILMVTNNLNYIINIFN